MLCILFTFIIMGIFYAAYRAHQVHKTQWDNKLVNALDGLNYLFCRYYHRLNYQKVPLPAQGSGLILANHLSGLDGCLLVAASERPLRFLIAREEYNRFGLQWLFKAMGCIPVDRSTRPEVALRAALRALNAGEILVIFPQGRITHPDDFPHLLKKGALWLAAQANSPVYLVYITGIKGVGHVVRGVLWRSEAHVHPQKPLDLQKTDNLDYLQHLFEGHYDVSTQ